MGVDVGGVGGVKGVLLAIMVASADDKASGVAGGAGSSEEIAIAVVSGFEW